MSRYIGNYLRVPASEPQQASASGIWSLSDQLAYQRANLWPPARDPYYNQTVLHLSGDVAAARETNPVTQPRTFLSDASTNNFLLTPNGDVSARPFSPYASSYSNYFDGSGDYLSRTSISGSSLIMGTDNFTAEVWVYPTTAAQGGGGSSYGAIFTVGDSTTAGWGIEVLAGTNTVNFRVDTATAYPFGASGTSPYPINTWYHLALVRNSGTLTFFVNGLIVNTGAFSTNLSTGADLYIGVPIWNPSVRYFQGFISNLRIIKGQCLFTGNFTPGIAPLTISSVGTSGTNVATAITGTVGLLTCHANRFIDGSANNFTLARTGDVAVAQNSPFVEYDTTSGSGYFDGTGDYLTAPASTQYNFGTGNFTIQGWIYIDTDKTIAGANGGMLFSYNFESIQIYYVNSPAYFYVDIRGWGTNIGLQSTSQVVKGQWYHLAVIRDGISSTKLYVNGVLEATNTTNPGSVNLNAQSLYTGVRYNPSGGALDYYHKGYISGFRITNTAVDTTTLLALPSPISGTQLLTLQTRAPANNQGILDTSPNNFVVTRTGNVAQGSFSPFSAGGWSNFLDGSTAYFTAAANSAINDFGTGDFNIELWFYATSANFATEPSLLSCAVTWATSVAYQFEIRTGGIVYFFAGDSVPININSGATTVSVNTWNHVAASRASGTTRLFVNGTQVSSTNTVATISKSSTAVRIGTFASDGSAGAQKFTGYLSNVRIVKGQALYTGNFTPPTAALTTTSVGTSGANVATSVTGTVGLLTCQSNRFLDQTGKTITVTGSPTVQPFSPFAPTQAYVASQLGGSAYFDGNGDYLTSPSDIAFAVGTGDFTLEAWAYWVGTLSAFQMTGSSNDNFNVYFNGTTLSFYNGTVTTTISGLVINKSSWNHIALVRTSGTAQFYLNGVAAGSGFALSTNWSTAIQLAVGRNIPVGTSYADGYISGFRFVKGTALYTSSFPIPTAPPTAISGTSLLLNFTGAGIVDATGKNVVETVGNSAVQTIQSRWSPGSLYFDGTGDYLKQPLTDLLKIGSGDYTFECWLYRNNSDDAALYTNRSNAQDGFLFGIRTNKVFVLVSQDGSTWAINTYATTLGNSVPVTTWSHIAISRQGSSWRVFIDGTLSYTSTLSGSVFQNQPVVHVGYDSLVPVLNGYIDDLRVTRGYARYVEGTGGNIGKMVFNGTTTLAFPTINTGPFPLA